VLAASPPHFFVPPTPAQSGWAAQAVRPSCLSAVSGKQQAAFKAKAPGRVAYRVGGPPTRAQGTARRQRSKGTLFLYLR
jgi:hypothetical protein